MLEKINKKIIPLSIIAAGIIFAAAFLFVNQDKVKGLLARELTPQQVAEKTINYLNKNLSVQGLAASLVDISDAGSVYKIRLKIEETEYQFFVSKDGEFLFPEGYNMEENLVTEDEPLEEEEFSEEELESLAKCLSEKGAKFYGASWCSWCNKQKEDFGEAAQYLPYIECIDSNTNEILAACQEAGITGFPTWEIAGEKMSGFKKLEELSELSGCLF